MRVWVEVDVHTERLESIIIDGNLVRISDQVVKAETALAIGVGAGNSGATHFDRNQHRVVRKVAPRYPDIADDFPDYAHLGMECAGSMRRGIRRADQTKRRELVGTAAPPQIIAP